MTNFLTFEHICESWSKFYIGTVLVKCQLRVKQRPCLTLKTKIEHKISTNWNKKRCWARSQQLWKYTTTTKSWINEKLQKKWKHCNKLMKGLQWTNEDNEDKFKDNVNDVWIDESTVMS